MNLGLNARWSVAAGLLTLLAITLLQGTPSSAQAALMTHDVLISASGQVVQSLVAFDDPPEDDTQEAPAKKRKKGEREPENSDLRKLTDSEINRVRFMELRGMRMRTRQPDRVTVKIPREVADEFLTQMEGHPDFQGEKARRAFHKSTPAQKLHYMAYYKGAMFADRVSIKTDPEVFVTFRKHVMPYVLRGCAGSSCHASTNPDERIHLRLYKDPKKSASTTYANFLMLDETEVGLAKMIDRGQPEASLLLTYMLPAADVKPELRHPGGITPKPLFQSRSVRQYQQILGWISSLKHPAEDYGVCLRKAAPAGTQSFDETTTETVKESTTESETASGEQSEKQTTP